MATKNISLTEEAYRRLRSFGKENESFSEIVMRITGKQDIRKFFGILSTERADELEKAIEKNRERHRRLRQERIKRIIEEV